MAAQQTITRRLNRIVFSGRLNAEAIPLLLQFLRTTKNLGFGDFVLDFEDCNRIYTNGMVPLAALVDSMRLNGDDFDLISPVEPNLAKLFENSGLANFIAPQKFKPSNFQGFKHISIQRFRSHEDQFRLVRSFMEIILKTTELSRDVFQGLEWSLNEVLDNIPNHAQSPVGGFASLTTLADSVSFTVADCGIGVLASLREGYPHLANDTEALGEAIKGGVTRNKQFGQGNGLAGTLNIATSSGGSFSISSGRGRLNVFYDAATAQPASKRLVYSPQESYTGTIFDVQVKKSPSFKVSDALGFTGMIGGQYDYIEAKYETERVTILCLN